MATVNEQIVTGRKFRKLVDEATKLWQRISFWTRASDVEFNDGSTAETKMGAINGITDSLVSTSSNIAASAKSVNQLNNKLAGQPEWVQDANGKITGYKTDIGGADTVFPFSSNRIQTGTFVINTNKGTVVNFKSPFNKPPRVLIENISRLSNYGYTGIVNSLSPIDVTNNSFTIKSGNSFCWIDNSVTTYLPCSSQYPMTMFYVAIEDVDNIT